VRSLACALISLLLAAGNAAAITRGWVGSSDNRWSVPANWSPNGAPQTGDELWFNDYGASSVTVMANDLPASVIVQRLVFYQVHNGNGPQWSVNGSPVRLSGSIECYGDVTFNVPVQLAGPSSIWGGTFKNGVDLGTQTLSMAFGPTYITNLSGSGTVDLNSWLTVSGQNTFSGNVKMGFSGSGHLELNGVSLANASATVYGYGDLGGSGTIGSVAFHGGNLGPGTTSLNLETFTFTPGRIDTGSLAFSDQITSSGFNASVGGTFNVVLAGTQPGNSYSQVNVTGTIDLGTTAPPFLYVHLAGFTPASGQQFVIMNNDGTDPVGGFFRAGGTNTIVTEGGELTSDGVRFRITYHGNDGNDIVLTALGASSTSLTSSSSASVSGESVTFTATVTGTGPTPAGNVSFYDAAALLGTAPLDASGQARLSAPLAAGSHTITASFNGDASHGGSTSSAITQNVAKASSAVAAFIESFGQPIVVRVTVGAKAPGSGTPGGSVTVSEGPTLLASSALSGNGSARFTLPILAAGSHTLTIAYSGDTQFFSGSTTLIVDGGSASVSASDLFVAEGNGSSVVFVPVTLFPPSAVPVSVEWSTEDGAAMAGSDYAADAGTVTFAPGQTSASIALHLTGDSVPESDEAFSVVLRSLDANVVSPRIRITILNDDLVPPRRRASRH